MSGFLSGVLFALALATSAYAGIAAAVLVVVLGLSRLAAGELPRPPALAAAAAVAVPAGLVEAWLFATGEMRAGGASAALSPGASMAVGSTSLVGLLSWGPAASGAAGGEAAPLGWTVLALAALAPVVLARVRGWRPWAALGLLGAALALGPAVRLDPASSFGVPGLLRPLSALGGWFRFPVRMAWLAELGLGLVAARVASELARRRARLAAPLLLAAAVDATVGSGALFAARSRSAELPSAYRAAPDAPVLDLYPEALGLPVDFGLEAYDLACFFGALHRRPVAARCLDTAVGADPGAVVRRWLQDALLRRRPAGSVSGGLARLGFGSVAFWAGLHLPADRLLMREGLGAALGPPRATSRDGGLLVELYAVPEPRADREAARWALARLRAGEAP